MNCRFGFGLKLAAVCACLVGVASPRAQAQAALGYHIIDLGTLGGTKSYARGINDSGQVTGYAYLAGNTAHHAFRYDSMTGMQDLGTLGGTNSAGYAINASGQIAGGAVLENGTTHAVRWTGTTPLDIAAGSTANSIARAINDAGHLTGNYFSFQGSGAFVFNGSSVTEFNLLINGIGNGINNAGTIVGKTELSWFGRTIYGVNRSPSGVLTSWSNEENREYFAVNNNGVIVGQTYYRFRVGDLGFLESAPDYAAMWQNGVKTNLGARGSVALAVNDRNQAVGAFDGKAVLFENGQTVDLNTLLPANSGWTLTEATGINNRGWIVGTGIHNGQTRAFLLGKNILPPIVAVRDFNHDGIPDLLTGTNGKPTYGYLKPTFDAFAVGEWGMTLQAPTSDWRVVGAGNFTFGQRTPDLVLTHPTDKRLHLWHMSGTTRLGGEYLYYTNQPNTHMTLPAGAEFLGTADFDNDGCDDIAWFDQANRRIGIWSMRGASFYSGAYLSQTLPPDWQIVGLGRLSVFTTSPSLILLSPTRELHLWEFHGFQWYNGAYLRDANTGSHVVLPEGWNVAGAADFDGDGTDEIVMQNPLEGKIEAWRFGADLVLKSQIPIQVP